MDSLADLVSFGVAPAAILFSIVKQSLLPDYISFTDVETSPLQWILLLSVLLVPVAGAFRLAKFNIDTRQSESFLGLPIPANAMFYASLALILEFGKSVAVNNVILNPFFIAVSCPCFRLMFSKIPTGLVEGKNSTGKGNQGSALSFLIPYALSWFSPATLFITFNYHQ